MDLEIWNLSEELVDGYQIVLYEPGALIWGGQLSDSVSKGAWAVLQWFKLRTSNGAARGPGALSLKLMGLGSHPVSPRKFFEAPVIFDPVNLSGILNCLVFITLGAESLRSS